MGAGACRGEAPCAGENRSAGLGAVILVVAAVCWPGAARATSAAFDIMFLFEATGAMSNDLSDAKGVAESLIGAAASPSPFDDLYSGIGFYREPELDGVLSDLNADPLVTELAMNPLIAFLGGDPADFGVTAILDTALNSSWRPGSARFIVWFGASPFKDSALQQDAIDALLLNDITVFAVDYEIPTRVDFEIGAGEIADATGGALIRDPSPAELRDYLADGILEAPEPTTLVLFGLGVAGAAIAGRRKAA